MRKVDIIILIEAIAILVLLKMLISQEPVMSVCDSISTGEYDPPTHIKQDDEAAVSSYVNQAVLPITCKKEAEYEGGARGMSFTCKDGDGNFTHIEKTFFDLIKGKDFYFGS